MTVTKTKTLALVSAAAPIGHNSGAADTGKVWSDNLTEASLRKFADLIAGGVRNRHEQRVSLKELLGAAPSEAALKSVRMVAMVAHILANAKIDAPDMSPAGRKKWAGVAYGSSKARELDEVMRKAYGAAKSAWSLLLADIGIGKAEGTKAKNNKATGKRGTPKARQDTGGAAGPVDGAKIVTRADYVSYVSGQVAALLATTNKHAGIAPGSIADLVHKLAAACISERSAPLKF